MDDEIRVEPFMIKKGNRVGRAAVKFNNPPLKGFHLVGFTICDEPGKGLFVLFPSSKSKSGDKDFNYYFLKPDDPTFVENLEQKILDIYESMVDSVKKEKTPA